MDRNPLTCSVLMIGVMRKRDGRDGAHEVASNLQTIAIVEPGTEAAPRQMNIRNRVALRIQCKNALNRIVQ
jgi:hypothetical protein